MPAEPLDRFERLFLAARMLSPEERAAFLQAACAGDSALREELGSLLRADEAAEAEAFLEESVADWAYTLAFGAVRLDRAGSA